MDERNCMVDVAKYFLKFLVEESCGKCTPCRDGLQQMLTASARPRWEQCLKPWDTAAGALIASEAGATVTTFSNQPYQLGDQEILVTNGHIHEEMLGLLKI